jgi:hypothetical protein
VTHPTQGPLGLMQQAATMGRMADEAGIGGDDSGGGKGGAR